MTYEILHMVMNTRRRTTSISDDVWNELKALHPNTSDYALLQHTVLDCINADRTRRGVPLLPKDAVVGTRGRHTVVVSPDLASVSPGAGGPNGLPAKPAVSPERLQQLGIQPMPAHVAGATDLQDVWPDVDGYRLEQLAQANDVYLRGGDGSTVLRSPLTEKQWRAMDKAIRQSKGRR